MKIPNWVEKPPMPRPKQYKAWCWKDQFPIDESKLPEFTLEEPRSLTIILPTAEEIEKYGTP